MNQHLGKPHLALLILTLMVAQLLLVGCGREVTTASRSVLELSDADLDGIEDEMRQHPQFTAELDSLAAKLPSDSSIRGGIRRKNQVLKALQIAAKRNPSNTALQTAANTATTNWCAAVGKYRPKYMNACYANYL